MKNKGFTLIEILIVLAVLAILIGIAVPRIKGLQDEARTTRAKAEMKTYQIAIESYRTNTGAYPATSATVGASTLAGATPMITGAIDDVFLTGTEYDYILSTSGAYYVIVSVGVDATAGSSSINDLGEATVTGDDICITNGSGC